MTSSYARALPLWVAWTFVLAQGLTQRVLAQTVTPVVINEIHYDPDVKTEHLEFIELHNPTDTPISLAGWKLAGAIEYIFPDTSLLAAHDFLVIAADPPAVHQKFAAAALGPWVGRLSNEGETITLRDASGKTIDEVDYKLGFPWPTVGGAPGFSIELIHPSLDNSLGGHWRASVRGGAVDPSQSLIMADSNWRYFKGTQEASDPPQAWRMAGFDDTIWLENSLPLGYGEEFLATVLDDMRGNYSSVSFRRSFEVSDPAKIGGLVLSLIYDDGLNVWINGEHVLQENVPSAEMAHDGNASLALEAFDFKEFAIPASAGLLVQGDNTIAIQVHNSSLDGSSDFFLNAKLEGRVGAANQGPTPGRPNAVLAQGAPPAVRQVEHVPSQPVSAQVVLVTAKVTDPDGVASVTLQYQAVDPGGYIELADPAYNINWASVPMHDAGADGDAAAGDDVYTAQLPASLQTHRRLVRYRVTAADAGGRTVTVPYPDDPQPNFAYFVYDGIPGWSGAIQPGGTLNDRGIVVDYPPEVMRRLPAYHLIAKPEAVSEAIFGGYDGDNYLWSGTLVYNGRVYDHIHFRARGGVWRYAMGKNMWKFDFNRGHDFQAEDNWGKPYPVGWTKLNLGACIQQADYLNRGEQGMFEAVGFKLFNLAGIEAPETHYITFRVIDEAAEYGPTQYDGDYWGLYLVIEQPDGRFLEGHGLPDGNFYKMEFGTGELNNQGPFSVSDRSDLDAFMGAYSSNDPRPSDEWWRATMNLPAYYNYRTIVECIHHYDIDEGAGKNYFFYLNPETQAWQTHPWDVDLTWANNMYGGGNSPFRSRVLSRPAFRLEYRNRAREIRDLLFNSDQADKLIDEIAAIIDDPSGGLAPVDVDRAQWDYNPIMTSRFVNSSKAGRGRFYLRATTKNFPGMVQIMKNYVISRGRFVDTSIANDPLIPNTPTITSLSPAGYAINRLTFRSSEFSGNGGAFAALQWRVGEVTDPAAPSYDAAAPRRYEIQHVWETGELTPFDSDIEVPPSAVKVGHAYRARIRMKDDTSRWSHWSAPVQFVVGETDIAAALEDHLRISELMYHHPTDNEFDYLELQNTSDTLTLDLSGLQFTEGISFSFPAGTQLPAQSYLLVVRASAGSNFAAFRSHYGLAADTRIAGPYTGNLSDDGENLTLRTAASGTVLFSFTYGDGRGWPPAADGGGHSLIPLPSARSAQATGALDYAGNWRQSTFLQGSPGRPDPQPPTSLVINEFLAHTDYSDPAHPGYDSNDWIEIYNPTDAPLSLEHWFLSDGAALAQGIDLKQWALPNTTLQPKSRIVFDEVTGFHQPLPRGFGLSKAGETLFLSYLPGTAGDRIADAVAFEGQQDGVTYGRFPDGVAHYWYPQPPSRGEVNHPPIEGLVISEIMYHPPATATGEDDDRFEFIELFNPTSHPIALSSPAGPWRLNGGLDFTFPASTIVPPDGYLLVVPFDPAGPSLLESFKSRYQIRETSITAIGPYEGRLDNRTDRIALSKPDSPDIPQDPLSWILVDEVIYADQAPWPASSDGTGRSLHRVSTTSSGNDHNSWAPGEPTPGRRRLVRSDTDADGMPDDWEVQFGLDPGSPSDMNRDADGDGATNLEEFIAGTNPTDPNSLFKITSVRVTTSQGAGFLVLEFAAIAGRSYALQHMDEALGAQWTDGVSVPGGVGAVRLTYPLGPSPRARLYRLLIRE